ncbi:MAG: DUF4625 domain-containing protein [Saonia sp.]
MKKNLVIPLCGLLMFSSCLDEGEEDTVDLVAPRIVANAGLASILPEPFFKSDADTAEIPLAFTVEDASGIREIKIESHSGFDGHTHGKSASARNPKFKLFSYNQVIGAAQFQDADRHSFTSSIYLDERNPDIEVDELVLGGPYHFSVQATDMEGNETTYGDNTTYHTTLYLNRPYAPQVELTDMDMAANTVNGRIFRNGADTASSDIAFLWIYIERPDTDNPNQEGPILKERIWGRSNWPHQFRANEGEALPDAKELDLQQLLGGDADFFGSLQSDTRLVVWAEDTNGNISVNQFNINN